jgi:hypothetical protein
MLKIKSLFLSFFFTAVSLSPAIADPIDEFFKDSDHGDALILPKEAYPVYGSQGVYFDYIYFDNQSKQFRWNKALTPFCAFGVMTDQVNNDLKFPKYSWKVLKGDRYSLTIKADTYASIRFLQSVCKKAYENGDIISRFQRGY